MMSLPNLALSFALLLPLLSTSCKGCGESEKRVAVPQIESRHARLLARMADHKIDRTQVYPKDADGYVQCDKKSTCFVLQAEGCARAKLSHRTTTSAYGIRQVANADYRIDGLESGRCKLIRHVTSSELTLDPKLVEMFHKQGKGEAEIDALKAKVTTKLHMQWPPQLECWFGSDDVLEATLDLSEGRHNPQLWRESCHEIDAETAQAASARADAAAGQPAAEPGRPGTQKAEGAAANAPAAGGDKNADTSGKQEATKAGVEPGPAAGKSDKTAPAAQPKQKSGASSAKTAPDKPAATKPQ